MNPILNKKISILIHLAAVDGEFAASEKSFIKNICKRNNLSPLEFNQLIQDPEPIGSLGALGYEKIVEYMSDCLSLMIVDGKILQSEVILVEDIGLRLGFHKNVIDDVIEELKRNFSSHNSNITKLVRSMPHLSKV